MHLIFTIILIALLTIFLFYVLFLKGSYSHKWSLNVRYIKKYSLNKLFLIRFEWLKIRRQNFMFYSLAIVCSFSLTLAISQFQQYTNDLDIIITQKKAIVADQLNINQQFEDYIASIEKILLDEDLSNFDKRQHEAQLDDVKNSYFDTLGNYEMTKQQLIDIKADNYHLLNKEAANLMEQDYHFVTGKAEVQFSRRIPMRHHIFVPNAYTNNELSHWKEEYSIAYVPQGGPFHTLFIPEYEESPRSGANQPPLGINQAVFENYLMTVSKPHQYKWLQFNRFTFYKFYLFDPFDNSYCILATIYTSELDNRETIRFLVTQPKTLKQIISTKLKVSYSATLLFLILSLIIAFIIGSLFNGVEQINFPFIQYIAKSIGDSNELNYFKIPSFNQYFRLLPL